MNIINKNIVVTEKIGFNFDANVDEVLAIDVSEKENGH